MKKLLGLTLIAFVITGLAGIAKSAPISATEFRGYRIEIDQKKLDALYSRILQQPQKAPAICFQIKRSGMTIGVALAEYDWRNDKIIFYLPSWPSDYTKDYKTFKKQFAFIFAHELGHAIGRVERPPFQSAKFHKQLVSIMAVIGNDFVFHFVFFSWLALYILSDIIPKLRPIRFVLFFILVILTFAIVGLAQLRENTTDKIANQLLKQYPVEFQEIVRVTKK